MRSPNKSRSRNKNRNRNNNIGNIVNRVFDSNGPDGRVRGTPNQIVEKYESLTRDAQLSGDRVEAENFSQHAEHYIRLLAAAQEEVAREQAKRQAEHDARMAEKAAKQEKDENSQDNDADEASSDQPEEKAEKKRAKKSKPSENEASEKSQSDDENKFDEGNAPDFLKVIND